jgi:POT family proton-dependent oligopeptide transporter
LDEDRLASARANNVTKENNGIVKAQVSEIKNDEVEITVSWFSILNSFFIIAFASFFSKWWESKYNPSAAVKYGLGLIIMAIGFGLLAWGSYGIEDGVKVSMIWLILAYMFHTLGELCLSPVGLSYVSKLVPARMIAFMFGMWYLAIAIGNKLAAVLGGQIENITAKYSLSTFFLIFTIVPIVAGLLVIMLNPVMKKLMHGVR